MLQCVKKLSKLNSLNKRGLHQIIKYNRINKIRKKQKGRKMHEERFLETRKYNLKIFFSNYNQKL